MDKKTMTGPHLFQPFLREGRGLEGVGVCAGVIVAGVVCIEGAGVVAGVGFVAEAGVGGTFRDPAFFCGALRLFCIAFYLYVFLRKVTIFT